MACVEEPLDECVWLVEGSSDMQMPAAMARALIDSNVTHIHVYFLYSMSELVQVLKRAEMAVLEFM